MCIIYLFVEKYKGIENRNFSFNGEYSIFYEKENLSLIKNENFINIFDNIPISAIAGQNGAGKSNIFEVLSKIMIAHDDTKVIIATSDNNQINIYTNIAGINVLCKPEINYKFFELDNFRSSHLIIYSSMSFNNGLFDTLIHNFSSTTKKNMGDSASWNSLQIQTLLNLVVNSSSFLSANRPDEYRQKNAFYLSEIIQNYALIKVYLIIHFVNIFGIDSLPFELNTNEKVTIKFQENMSVNRIHQHGFVDVVTEFFETNKKASDGDAYDTNLQKLVTLLQRCGADHIKRYEVLDINFNNAITLIELYTELFRLSPMPNYLFSFSFKSLSSGETNFILLFALLNNAIKVAASGEKQNVIILFDEVENSLHPLWQKNIIDYMHKMFSTIQSTIKKLNFNLIFATHSPFILSDIPATNILFIKKQKDKCIVAKDAPKLTFAGNIHTLLSHAFFMNEDVVGSFAKRHIENIIKSLKSSEKIDDIKQRHIRGIIHCIGEDFLRYKLLEMYNEKFPHETLDEEEAKLLLQQAQIAERIQAIREAKKHK